MVPRTPAARSRLVGAVVSGSLLLVGCGASGSTAEDVASRFYAAVESGQSSTACDLLAPETRHKLEQSAGQPCAEALLSEDIPTPGESVETQRFGNQAQIQFDHDTAFLAEFDDGWRLVAAGCTPREPLPYDCVIAGA